MGMKLEAGKFYRSTKGEKIGPMIHHITTVFIINKGDGCVWKNDGSCFNRTTDAIYGDLIAEWPAEDAPTGPVRTVTRQFGPSIEALRLAVSYDKDSGELTWNHRDDMRNSWNAKHAGKPAFATISEDGYKRGRIGDFFLPAHRVAWAIHYGEWPKEDIDHINRDSSDNRITNLRLVTASQNQWNKEKYSNNTSGYKGVTFSKDKSKWVARISKNGVTKHLGYFDDPSDAADAYIQASLEMHGVYSVAADHGCEQ